MEWVDSTFHTTSEHGLSTITTGLVGDCGHHNLSELRRAGRSLTVAWSSNTILRSSTR